MLAWIVDRRPGPPAPGRAVAAWSMRLSLGAAVGLGLSMACNVEPGATPQFAAHCGDEAGDATCAVAHPSQPFCSLCVSVAEDEGCVSSPPVPACRPGGGGVGPGDDGVTDGGETTGSTDGVTDDGDSGTTTGSADTVAVDETASSGSDTETFVPCEGEGAVDRECEAADPAAPFCVQGVCQSCTDAGGDVFCGGVDAATPACDGALGSCVACYDAARPVCGSFTPICDGTAGMCMPCTTHDECEGTACHLSPEDPLQGSCFAPEEVVYVDATSSCPGTGAEATPFCSLEDTMSEYEAGDQGVIFLVAGDPYAEDVVLDQPATVAVLGVGAPSLVSNPGTSQPSLRISDGALVYLSSIRVNDNDNQHGITCDEAAVVLTDSEVAGNARWGVFVTSPCSVTLDRSTVHHNDNGGVRMLGGALQADNATIAVNGNGLAGPGVQLLHADFNAVYSTVAGNDGFGPDSLQCEGQVAGVVRNSIFNGVQTESVDLDCFALMFDNNAVSSSAFGGGTNSEIGAFVSAYFTDPDDGEFRLAAPPLTPYGEVAQWLEDDPRFDADGTERPTDALGYAGIDEP